MPNIVIPAGSASAITPVVASAIQPSAFFRCEVWQSAQLAGAAFTVIGGQTDYIFNLTDTNGQPWTVELTATLIAPVVVVTMTVTPPVFYTGQTGFSVRANNNGSPGNVYYCPFDIAAAPAPTIVSFTATPSTIAACSGSSTLAWTVTGADTVTISPTIGSVGLTGSQSVTPGATTTYTLTATKYTTTTTATVTVTVTGALMVTSVVTSAAVQNFNSGANFAAGRWRVGYAGTGAYKINGNSPNWGVQYNDNDAQIGGVHGFYITDGAGNVAYGPGNTIGYPNQAAAEVGNSGLVVFYDHVGGKPIGMYLYDGEYGDNVAGSPNPQFFICGPLAASLTANVSQIDVGGSATLTWASTNADTASDPVGGSTTSGSQSVSPTTTTTYIFTATGFSGTIAKTVTVTITVNQPAVVDGLAAVGACGGTIGLSWLAAAHASSYVLQRSADGVSGWSTIASQVGLTFTDTPPLTATAYFYRVASVSGSVTSAYRDVVSAATLVTPSSPPAFSIVAHGGSIAVTWAPVTNATSYSVKYGTSHNGPYTTISGLTGTSTTITGLMDGTVYYVIMTASSACGETSAAAEQSAMPECCANAYSVSASPPGSGTTGTAPTQSGSLGSAPSSVGTFGSAPSSSGSVSVTPSTTWTVGDCPE